MIDDRDVGLAIRTLEATCLSEQHDDPGDRPDEIIAPGQVSPAVMRAYMTAIVRYDCMVVLGIWLEQRITMHSLPTGGPERERL